MSNTLNASHAINELCAQQSWGADTKMTIAWDFLVAKNLLEDFSRFMAEKVKSLEIERIPDMVKTMKSLGFELVNDNQAKKFHWQHELWGGSEDFDTEAQAWFAAFEHYVSQENLVKRVMTPPWKSRTLERRLAVMRQDRAYETAREVFESYDFGANVVDSSGWSTDSNYNFEKAVFLENEDPEQDSIKVTLYVRLDPDNLFKTKEIYVSKA